MLPRVAYGALWDFVPYAEVAKMPLDLLVVKGVVALLVPLGMARRKETARNREQ